MADAPATAGVVVVVLADDLIWASRLADAVTAAGATPRRIRRVDDLAPTIESTRGPSTGPRAVIDLTARAYDGVSAIRAAREAGVRVVAVGQHDDAELRRAALDAGAERVFPYRALFEGGAKLLRAWLAG